uniref:C2H2-type domain-containing protein n=1 Tax=Timema shepardi TaxID=629360 RepID=A0A7R9G1P8_TIMSH|nr:unnamed protein product [Timema shepardi]
MTYCLRKFASFATVSWKTATSLPRRPDELEKDPNKLNFKHDPEDFDVKDEIMDLPLDVTLDSDFDNHIDTVSADSTSEEQSTSEAVLSPTSSPLPKKGARHHQDRRRKMLQPKKKPRGGSRAAQSAVVTRRRGRPRRAPPPSLLEHDSEEEERRELEEGDHQDMMKWKEDEDMLTLNHFKDGLGEDEEEDEEEYDEEDEEMDEIDKKAQEEWKTHWGIKCDRCEAVFPFKSQFDNHYRSSYNARPTYTCSYCNKTMEKYSTFRSHCYRHVTEGRYRCEYCQKGFSLRSMLHVHILAKHTMVKPYICEECGKGFVTRPGLNIHLKKHKTDEKLEYPCSECGKVLHTRGGLTAHQNVHKLGRRFMCDVCGKTFTQKVNMQQHVKHHTGERPYACEKCGKCFAEKSHLNRHYSFHSEKRPFECKTCNKMYKTERCLKVHAMVHAEARPHVCTYCSKGFLSTTKLKQHYNIHTGERPYVCKFCERTFTNYPNWLKHTRRRHKTDPRTLRLAQASGVLPVQQEGIPTQSPDEKELPVSLGDSVRMLPKCKVPNYHKFGEDYAIPESNLKFAAKLKDTRVNNLTAAILGLGRVMLPIRILHQATKAMRLKAQEQPQPEVIISEVQQPDEEERLSVHSQQSQMSVMCLNNENNSATMMGGYPHQTQSHLHQASQQTHPHLLQAIAGDMRMQAPLQLQVGS